MKTTKSLWAILTMTALALGGCAAETSADDTEAGDEAMTAAQAKARVETFEGDDGKQYFHIVAKNGQVVLQSEGYESLAAAKNGARSAMENAQLAGAFELRDAKDGETYFVLKAANHEIVGTSEMYTTRGNAQKGADGMKALAHEVARAEAQAAKRLGRFESFSGEDQLVYFSLFAGNGQIVMQSQGYQSIAGAKKGVKSVRANGLDAHRYEVLQARDGQWYFHLKAGNNEIIARSEMYASKQSAERGRDAIIELLDTGIR
jgi:uncharacterized protein YegP (UPF0339 family)